MKIKAKEIRQMNEKQIKEKLFEVKKDLMKANSQIAVGTVPENPGQVKQMKKTIARMLTILTEKEKEPKQEKNKSVKETKEEIKKQ
ncbi:MAG: 50S ribosomal protein L29 [Nanoarchaeota archaeon]|nr:50S ribosomal protein L29 [Nanoarchaeota archaeon]MBU4241884.1 50S ribosomal protein L29 [Nanoarchaeota archaeon]MBU4352472.1 50S ribosomal protein L29 [Nanoarchaeota archaeon]MBU4455999.1 50S ribosomal protein L29 [Nanoarchaeota archaeon]MCG2719418.1 50S ribosomal protein L29 [Nanoarchaeota archaeon]